MPLNGRSLVRHVTVAVPHNNREQTNKGELMAEHDKPIHKIRYGSVTATIWANNSMAGYFYNSTFKRSFRKADESWSETDSFDDRDLPALAKAANDAHSSIYAAKARANVQSADGDEPERSD